MKSDLLLILLGISRKFPVHCAINTFFLFERRVKVIFVGVHKLTKIKNLVAFLLSKGQK